MMQEDILMDMDKAGVGASIIEITSKLSDPDLGSVAQMLSKLMIAPAGEAV